jgi:hypothetical protein
MIIINEPKKSYVFYNPSLDRIEIITLVSTRNRFYRYLLEGPAQMFIEIPVDTELHPQPQMVYLGEL